MKKIILTILCLVFSGCGFKIVRVDRSVEKAKQKHLEMVELAVIEAVKNNEQCSTICVKLKELNAALLDRWYGRK